MRAWVAAALVLGAGCAATRPVATSAAGDGTPAALAAAAPDGAATTSASPTPEDGAAKIAAPIAEIVGKLRAAAAAAPDGKVRSAQLYSTPFVKVDSSGRVQVYLHVASLGDEERRDLTDAGVRIDAAIERLKIVQTWLPFDQVEAIARLPLVVRITPPSYATPR
ncbi:MAG: hypothetical protein U0610_00020 [bacterium]